MLCSHPILCFLVRAPTQQLALGVLASVPSQDSELLSPCPDAHEEAASHTSAGRTFHYLSKLPKSFGWAQKGEDAALKAPKVGQVSDRKEHTVTVRVAFVSVCPVLFPHLIPATPKPLSESSTQAVPGVSQPFLLKSWILGCFF